MHVRPAIALVATAIIVSGCGALLGLDALDRVDCVGDGCPFAGTDAAIDPETGKPFMDATSTDAPPLLDAGADVSNDADAKAPPAICNGLMLWVSFEKDVYVAKPSGVPTEVGGGTATFTPEARYGIAGFALGGSGTVASLVYPVTWPYTTEGTVSMWIRKALGSSCGGSDFTFFSSNGSNRGPTIKCNNASGSLQLASPDGPGAEVYAYSGALNPNWVDPGGWNHVVATWKTGNARVYLNGTGDNGIGYNAPVDGGQPAFGDATLKPNATYDDLLVWSRALSPAEVTEVRTSVKSTGEVCFGPP